MVAPEVDKYKKNDKFIDRYFIIILILIHVSSSIKKIINFSFKNDLKDIFSPLVRWIDPLLKLLTKLC